MKQTELGALEAEVNELRHAVNLLSGMPVQIQMAGRPAVPRRQTPVLGEVIGVHRFPSGRSFNIYRRVMTDVMEIVSKRADDEWFKSDIFRGAVGKHYGIGKEASAKDMVTAYLRFLVAKGIIEHNGKPRRHSRYRKAAKIHRDTPGAEEVAKRIAEERQLLREVQSR